MIVRPPLLAGAVNVTVTLRSAPATPVIDGAPGGPVGVTEFEAPEATPVPALFVAFTVKVYAVPLLKPLTLIGLVVPLPVLPPGLEVTV